MFKVLGDLDQSFFADHALERWHDGLEAGDNLRVRIKNRFTDVVIIGDHDAVIAQADRTAVKSLQVRAPGAGIRAMAECLVPQY